MSESVPVCRYCLSTQIIRNTRTRRKWYCESCGKRFDDPKREEKQTDGLSGLPKRLLERGE